MRSSVEVNLSYTGMRTVLYRPVLRSPRGTPGWVRDESPVFSRSSLITSSIGGLETSSDRTATICKESGERPHDNGWLSARAVSDLIAAPFSATSERISLTNEYVDAIRRSR